MAFDVITPAQLGRGPIETSINTFYTVDSHERIIMKTIDICNTTSSPITVTLYLVPNGSSASSSNMLIPGIIIGATVMFQWSGAQVLSAGDTIQAVASISGTTLQISGAHCV